MRKEQTDSNGSLDVSDLAAKTESSTFKNDTEMKLFYNLTNKRFLQLMLFVLLLLVPFNMVEAQYKIIFKTTDGLSTDYWVQSIDSIVCAYIVPDKSDNNEDEATVTGDAFDISIYTAKVKSWANVLDNLSTDLRIGVIYCTSGTPTKNNGNIKEISSSQLAADASYTVTLTDLAPNTMYYYRSFVYQSGVWFYGKVKSFTTQTQGVSLVTGETSKVTCFSAKATGSVSIGPATQYSSLSYGICYGTDTMPNVGGNKLEASSKDEYGTFTCQLRALSGSTTYYYRSYAYIDGFPSYGPLRSFTTKADNVVTTGEINTASHIVNSTLTIGGGAYSTLMLGVCYGTDSIPTVDNISVTTNEIDDEGCYALKLTGLEGINYYRAFVLIDGVAHYGIVKSFEHCYEYVDLGLPSGTLWATMNVGAENPEDYGDYFAWGETTGYDSGKTNFDWSTYKWCNGSSKTITKYCKSSRYGTVDNKTELELEDDAARANWGGSWCMPSSAQINELKNECNTEWTTQGGVYGYKFTNKTNGNSIFLPAAGCRQDSSLKYAGSDGGYWSRSLKNSLNYEADCLYFCSGGFYESYGAGRCTGRSIRPVLAE